MKVSLLDGTVIELDSRSTAADLAAKIGAGLARAALGAKINGRLSDLSDEIHDNDQVEIVTFDSGEGKKMFWHSSSHVLASAVQELFPEAKLAIGPAVEGGFYYDFDVPEPFTPDNLEKIENRCREIARKKLKFNKKHHDYDEIKTYYEERGEIYKLELLNDIEGRASVYYLGEDGWSDLCRGPHIPDTGKIKAFKILSSAGAYWRGNEKNKMLQRIYGVSFPKKSLLDNHLELLEEAKKRDHRKLGRELDLFSFHLEGAGFPFWHPKGMLLYNSVMDFCREKHLEAGYVEIKTPVILNEELWRRSGHWDKYRDNMYFTQIDDTNHAVKPMNCPGGLLVYKNSAHSYREFPLKVFEFGLVHRHEKAGVLHGLFRVRQFTQDDAHIFCTPDQIEDEVGNVVDFVINMYNEFGFNDYEIELSTRPEEYIGDLPVWEKAETALKNVLDKAKIEYKLNPGDGAFYGPKIDFHILDSLKRSWQCGTIQLDFSMPDRFELEYTGRDGSKKRPVMIHRALLGSFERFIGIMIEHYGGSLPVWLSPVQVKVIPLSDKYLEYAEKVKEKLEAEKIRTELDNRTEKVGYKIRNAELEKIPYMVIAGEKEEKNNSVAVRIHGSGDQGELSTDEFIKRVTEKINNRSLSIS